MKTRLIDRVANSALTLLPVLFIVYLFSGLLHSCQRDGLTGDEELLLKAAAIPEITLTYPSQVTQGKDFDIVFSSTCGKLKIERGYVNGDPIMDGDVIVGYEKLYTGLTCETEFLQWEYIENDEFMPCSGGTITQNWPEVGTYVYRIKLNAKSSKHSECPDCGTIKGNLFRCFVINVVEATSGTFIDTRDQRVYQWIKIGNQVWMAENLAYLPSVNTVLEGSQMNPRYYVYGYNGSDVAAAKLHVNYVIYGGLYNWPAAKISCPYGWHLPSHSEWTELSDFLINNGYGYQGSGDDIAKALAAKINWNLNGISGTPGNQPELNNSTGFSAFPGGYRVNAGIFSSMGEHDAMWSSEEISTMGDTWGLMWDYDFLSNNYNDKSFGFAVRCIKD